MQKSQDSQIKFAIIGAHSTGKSTHVDNLYNYLNEKEIHVNKVSEVARECPFEINENTSIKAQEWIILNQILKEEDNKRFDVLITDRSVLDGYIYLLNYLNEDHNKLFDKVLIHLKTYDTLFVTSISPGKTILNDGVRSISKTFQKNIELAFNERLDLLDKFLKDNNVRVIRTNKFEEIKDHVDARLKL